jgi:uncharacterized membrane protein YkvI
MGTVVGAGFASGQEVLRFFSHFGGRGTLGLAGATLLLLAGGAGVCELGRRTRAASFGDTLVILAGPAAGRILDATMSFLLFGGTAVMTAGSGALFHEHLGLPSWLGSAVLVATAVGTVAFGLRGVVAANQLVVPLLVAGVLAVSASSILSGGTDTGRAWWHPGEAAHPSPAAASILYASYNLFLSLGVLAPLGASANSSRTVVVGGVLGGLGLGAAALAVHLAVLSSLPQSAALAVPMLQAAAALPRWARTGYALILFAEVYTTAVANLFALERRLTSPRGAGPRSPHRAGRDRVPGGRRPVRSTGSRPGVAGPTGTRAARRIAVLVAMGVLALLASRLGFPRLVVTIYPLAGYVGLLVLLALPVALWRTRGL